MIATLVWDRLDVSPRAAIGRALCDRMWRRISHRQRLRDVNGVREGVAEWWIDLGGES